VTRSTGFGTILFLLALAWPAHAHSGDLPPALLEPPAAAQGYYLSLGLHGGVLTAKDDGDTLTPLGGYAGALHIGQEVRPWMDLGLALEFGSVSSDQRTGWMGSLGMEWTLRPVAKTFVRLGCGIGISRLSAAENSDNKANASGGVAAITLGYAWFPFRGLRESGGFAISPVIRVMAVQPFAKDAAYWTTAGFEVAFWTGLPQRQLDLPLEDAFPAQRPNPAPTTSTGWIGNGVAGSGSGRRR
jgi:hypothetical protein